VAYVRTLCKGLSERKRDADMRLLAGHDLHVEGENGGGGVFEAR